MTAVAAADSNIGDVVEIGDEQADEDVAEPFDAVVGLSDAIKLSKSRKNLFAHIFTSSDAASAADFICNCLRRRLSVDDDDVAAAAELADVPNPELANDVPSLLLSCSFCPLFTCANCCSFPSTALSCLLCFIFVCGFDICMLLPALDDISGIKVMGGGTFDFAFFVIDFSCNAVCFFGLFVIPSNTRLPAFVVFCADAFSKVVTFALEYNLLPLPTTLPQLLPLLKLLFKLTSALSVIVAVICPPLALSKPLSDSMERDNSSFETAAFNVSRNVAEEVAARVSVCI